MKKDIRPFEEQIVRPYTITKQPDILSTLAQSRIPTDGVGEIYTCARLTDIDPSVTFKPDVPELSQNQYLDLIKGVRQKMLKQLKHRFPHLKRGEHIMVDDFQTQISLIPSNMYSDISIRNAEVFASGSVLDIWPNGHN